MAGRNEFDKFAARMDRVGDQVENNAATVVRRAALAADQVVVLATPVDTGRARANWTTSVGAPTFTNKDPPPDPGGSALAQAREVIGTWRPGLGSIYISNGVDYVQYLDEGSSAQAPEGMTSQGIAAARQVLRAARLLGENRG
jgi:hypothetical protein